MGSKLGSQTPIGPNLKRAQTEYGIASEALARKMDLSLKTVERWRSGERTPRYRDVERLADLLDKPIEYFYMWHDEERRAA